MSLFEKTFCVFCLLRFNVRSFQSSRFYSAFSVCIYVWNCLVSWFVFWSFCFSYFTCSQKYLHPPSTNISSLAILSDWFASPLADFNSVPRRLLLVFLLFVSGFYVKNILTSYVEFTFFVWLYQTSHDLHTQLMFLTSHHPHHQLFPSICLQFECFSVLFFIFNFFSLVWLNVWNFTVLFLSCQSS